MEKALFGVSLFALMYAVGPIAYAQTSPSEAAASDAGIQVVVVTATRRATTTQKTPLTMEVIGSDQIARSGNTSLDSVLNNVPAVSLQQNNKGLNVNIRGVGTSLDSAAGDPGVNTNLDGLYLREATQVASALFDVARVEVVKGPQGTLYGRNATGGVVNILTNDPVQSFQAKALVSAGNYNLLHAEGVFNTPLTDTLALRAAFSTERHDGYMDSGQDDVDRIAGRVKLLWTPTEDIRLLVGTAYSHDGGQGPGSSYDPGQRHVTYTHSPAGQLDNPVWTAFAQLDWNLGGARLTFLPTWSHYKYDYLGTSYGFYSHQKVDEVQTTAELRLAAPVESKLQWVTGLYYYKNELANYANLLDSGIVNDQPELHTNSYAAFADATWPVTDRFRLSAGIRYTQDKRSQTDTYVSSGPTTVGPLNGKLDSQATNYRLGTQYDVAKASMLYATYATGYKAGGFLPDEPGYNTFKPETVTSFEVGSKNRFFGNRFQVNLSLFDYTYENYQVSQLGTAHYGGLSALVFNAQGKTKVSGAELQLTYRPTTNDQFDLSLAPLNTKFGYFFIPGVTIMTPGGPLALTQDLTLTGEELPSSPAMSGNFAYDHTWAVSAGEVRAHLNTYFSSKYWAEFSHAPTSEQPGYTRTDANLTYTPANANYTIGVYVRNIEDNLIVTQLANTTPPSYGLQAPRTFGVTLTFSN